MVMASFDPRHIKTYFPALARVTERFESAGGAPPRRARRSTCRRT